MKIRLEPMGVVLEGSPDKTLLQLAQENKIKIKSLCNGKMSCGECRVKILAGENNVLPPAKAEINVIGSSYFVDHRRLGCQLKCFGDVVVDMSEHVNAGQASSHKKLRGAKKGNNSQSQSQAVNDTFILSAKIEEEK